ncbi:WD40/YVTN/BNR-like repeat-containing protein [Crocinitomix algicola]|uniref:WD40/YVTN/BNR-like repeat-containing protein n=1 Tax=Crocinitomix algicola TaxID=1740263 RepID=UPI00082D4125|nr:hypothetical protein [Crocinitomix algicola]
MKKGKLILGCFLLSVAALFSQNESFSYGWQPIGPMDEPENPRNLSASGIGPVEFIQLNKNKKGAGFAGSLNGGLFYSDDDFNSWINAGSDRWPYAGCSWADFYPDNDDIWFAVSVPNSENGGPSIIDERGGLMRTKNKGLDWECVASYVEFDNNPWVKIYATRFDPSNPNMLYILTSNGLYFSSNCLAENFKIEKFIEGSIYDMVFYNDHAYLTQFKNNEWSLLQFSSDQHNKYAIIGNVIENTRKIDYVTLAIQQENLLILEVYPGKSDVLSAYNMESHEIKKLVSNLNVNFGFGHTFSVNPHRTNEVYIGHSTRIKKFENWSGKTSKINSDYHPDIEDVTFDPFDENRVYIATHGGVYISYNNGESWEFKSRNLGISEVMGLAVNSKDINQVAVGLFHDGSLVRNDFNGNGKYTWRTVNGGDGLIPLIDSDSKRVFTSNQYRGGGLYVHADSTENAPINLHNKHQIKTPGWEMTTVMHPTRSNIIYFNYEDKLGINKGNTNVCRLVFNDSGEQNLEVISDFNASHQMEKYRVFGLFSSPFLPNTIFAYVLQYTKNEKGDQIIKHRLFRNNNNLASSLVAIRSWYEIQLPKNSWIADVAAHPAKENWIFVSYSDGIEGFNSDLKTQMVYALKYKNKQSYKAARKKDISQQLPSDAIGRFNLVSTKLFGGGVIIATRSGVYFGSSKVMKGRRKWERIGTGLPNCKVYGITVDDDKKVITVGLYGRGVWQYFF